MEVSHAANEHTPLLQDGATSTKSRQLLSIPTSSNDQTPLHDADITSNKQTPFFGQVASHSDRKPLISNSPITFDREMDEVPLEEIAQALCSAWQRHRQLKRQVTMEYFTTKELYAMHLAWKYVTRGRHCSLPPHIVADYVAVAITKIDVTEPYNDFNTSRPGWTNFIRFFTTDKSIITANLLNEWDRITKGVGFPVRYIETIFEDPDEQTAAVSTFRIKLVELYDKFHDPNLNPKLKSFLNCLLIIWPIFIIIIGSKYMECPMSYRLSFMLIVFGCVGCLAILTRFALMYLATTSECANDLFWERIGLKLIEFTFLVAFIVQAIQFFNTKPTTEPGSNQCVQNFYDAALVINYLSIVLISVYVFVYSLVICKNRFDFWHRIFRYV